MIDGDRHLTRSHLYASDLLRTVKRLTSEADEAAWNFDFDVSDDLNRRAAVLRKEAYSLLSMKDEIYPLF